MQEISYVSQFLMGEMFVMWEILYAWWERGRNSVQGQGGDSLSMRELTALYSVHVAAYTGPTNKVTNVVLPQG